MPNSSSNAKRMNTNTEYHVVNFNNETSHHSDEDLNRATKYKEVKAKGKRQEIAWNALLLTLPMLVLTCVMFAFVFGYKIDRNDEPYPNLRGNESALGDNDAYYVNLNSTFLIFIASWMSSLAPMLAGFAITLAAYPIAAKLFEDTTSHNRDRLLTPFQLNITLRLVNGSTWSGLWSLILYRLGWGRRVRAQGAALTSFLRVTLMVILMSILVFGADTWLHIVTKTVSLTRLSALSAENNAYSIALLSPNCTSTNNTISQLAENNLTCTMNPGTAKLEDGTSALQTLNNQSNLLSAYNNGPDPSFVYLGYSSRIRNTNHDFTATTFGVQAQCKSITQSCGLGSNASDPERFDCRNGSFTGKVLSGSLPQGYFGSADMSPYSGGGVDNPYYYTAASTSQGSANPTTNLPNDPDVQMYSSDYLAIILFCNVTFYDVEYDLVEGNVAHFRATPSNSSVANVFVPGLENTNFADSSLQKALQFAAVIASDAQDLADQFAIAYARTALSIGAGSFIRTPAVAVQERNVVLVARVPKAPLYLLVIINLVFVVMGFVLTIIALRTSQEAHHVQNLFSIAGIVAGMFEGDKARSPVDGVEKLYAEYYDGGHTSRVGIQHTSLGGYEFRALEKELGNVHYFGRSNDVVG